MENPFKDRFVYEARLVKIVDGDTIDINIDLGFKIFHEIRIRLKDIEEKIAGYVSKDAISEILEGKNQKLFIETEKTGKYGRYLATVWVPTEYISADMLDVAIVDMFNDEEWLNVNEYMVFHKFAKRYGE